MDPSNLQTASVYINNLLLSRGLLRNGVPIPFATPSDAGGGGGTDTTMARVMNLVHDMVLRRDREADTLCTLSQNLQALRNTSTQQCQTIARLESRNAELERQLALSGAQERAAKATLRSAENRTRALREEMGRLKVAVAQIRGQCANDIRRRDGEIGRLKRHLDGRRGRDGNGGQVGVVVVLPGLGGKGQRGGLGQSAAAAETDVDSPQYSLKQETTDFLTQLSQSLSDENDALIGLVRSSLITLRGLQGLPASASATSAGARGASAMVDDDSNVILTPPASFEVLAADMDEVLEHLRGLLTNPSFVPIEEVEVREDEIVRLRDAWEKMEARWREAVGLMDGWRKRMTESGDTINLDDLTMGLNLGSECDVATSQRREEPTAEKDEEGDVCLRGVEERDSSSLVLRASSVSSSDELTSEDRIPGNVAEGFTARGSAFLDSNVLSQGSGNARHNSSRRNPSNGIPVEGTEDGATENVAADSIALLRVYGDKVPPQPVSDQNDSRLPRHTTQNVTTAPMAVQEKLDRAGAEAEEVRTREHNTTGRKSVATKKVGTRSNWRRSTISPQELESWTGFGY
ncbi:Afadin/alpha-actinin-binding [Lasallia pustulata]|uniref:Afadin/alpha-actinin-binding n=1 Tax=Lasallia pustulata TaxID=136370 RepID=A0A1W5CTC0_9LECA|nr:Afadin/alpha-actinin-binding [Lasallia pustulata]